ncbi:hypothetical protein Vretifemale_10757 [Volvox reticuliferus]|uniref:Uncharacterized protein n=1 Tax=Volvox reticuliferus TaxID=1737510 RepID=A0A8J4CHD2_9CHLO|nr:hypothetical protein Vretifemale_10757 [Volvox reticuliferus]
MSDSQPLDSRERMSKQPPRYEKVSTPALACVASPSPAKARRRPATERPSLQSANMAPVKLPSELFAIATSRSVQGDLALSKALDGIQAAATRLETERTKLVIQSQELQIWDMAREEELVLLRAENEQLEQQLAAVADKVGKGIGRDGVLDGLQYALRKARMERDAEMREADSLFNQLQEAKAAAMELQELRTAFSAALSSLKDEWSAIPLLSHEARDLRAKADAAIQDPTNLGHKEIATLLGGLLALASRGSELQHEAQTLRGEKAALQQVLDAAHQQLSEQAELLATHSRQVETAARQGRHSRSLEQGELNLGHARKEERLRQQVSELQAKLEEYRSYLQDNQEEIEALQAEVKRLRQASSQAGEEANVQALIHAAAPRGPSCYGTLGGSSCTANGTVATAQPAGPTWRRQMEQQPPKPPAVPQPVAGTPTRHVPSSSSPISTVNYDGSPPLAASPPIRASPMSQPVATDFALKVAELQELAIRAQQQAVEREVEIMRQHDEALEALRQQLVHQKDAELAELAQQQAKALAEAQDREAELGRQHARALADLEAQAAKQAARDAAALADLNAMMAKLVKQHAQALVEREAALATELQQRLRECEVDLQRQHADALAAQADAAEARLAVALAAQAAELAKQHAQEQREAEERQGAQAEARLHELEVALERRFSEQLAVRDAEVRRKHAERLAEQAAQLAQLHAEQLAQLQMQHAEATADREAELLDQFERQLVERESQLANAHADQLRDLEARFTAQAAEAVHAREAQLRKLFADQLMEALRQQQESLEAAQAEVRMQEAERAAAAAEQARVAHAQEVAQVARQAQEYLRRREADMVALLEEQQQRLELLERQITAAELESQAAQATDTTRDGVFLGDVTSIDDADADIPPTDHQARRLAAEQSEQLQQLADELEMVRGEAERRREQEVAEVERKYVEIVARLGREHEKAFVEARTAHELREGNLRRMLERQAQEARDAELRHKEQLEKLEAQVVEIRTLLVEERERHSSSSAVLEERAVRLATELDAARRREAEVLRVLAASRKAGNTPPSKQGSGLGSADDSTGARLSSVGTPFTAVSTGPAPNTAEPSSGPADSWSDGQALQWPAHANVSTSACGSGRNSSTGGGTSAGVPVAVTVAVSTTAPGGKSPGSGGPSLDAGVVQSARSNREKEDVWGEFVCAPQGVLGHCSRTDVVRLAPGSSAAAGASPVAAGDGSSAAAAAGPGYVSEPATSVSTDTEYNSDTEFYVDDHDDEERRGRALAAALAQSPRGSQVDFPAQLPPLLQEAQLQQRQPLSPCAVVAHTRPTHGPVRDSYIANMTGAGRTPAPSFVASARKDGESGAGLSTLETNEALVVDDLEATFWGVFPAVDMKEKSSGALGFSAAAVAPPAVGEAALVAAGASATAATPADVLAGINLEATLSGNFPALPQFLSALQHHLPSLSPAEDGKVPTELVDGGDSASHSAVLTSHPASVTFSFPGPQHSAPEWDGTSFGSGNQLAALSDTEQEERSRAIVEAPKELIDLAARVDFSPGTQLRSRTAASTPSQQAEPEDDSMAPSDSMAGQVPHDRIVDSACTKVQTANAGISYVDENSRSDRGGSAASLTSCSLPLLPRIQASVQSPHRQVWVDLTDEEESSTADDCDDKGANDSAFGSGTQDGSAWPPPPAAARAAAGITPLLVPNPLFNETDEVSPPWSAADWSTGGSPLNHHHEMQNEGASLPSTPGNETRGSSASSSSSDDLADYNTGGFIATGAISYEAWNTLYDMPEENSSPELEIRRPLHEHAAEGCHSNENTRCGNLSRSRWSRSVESAETTPQRRVGDGRDECRSCAGSGVQRELEAGQQTDEQTGERKEDRQSSCGPSDSEEDDMRSLLAAGATLSNSERRRRQRRRMGDAPVGPLLEHPIDLLRQGWEFSGGVASPISPRSTPHELTPADAPWQESPTQHTAPATASPKEQRSQREGQQPEQLQQLLPLHALQRGRNSPSPARPRSCISTPSPRASPLSKSPISSTGALRRTGGSTGAASPRPYTDLPALEASPGALSALTCTTPSSAMAGRALSPLEVRQRSRALLGRARSRVAELEDQCRALAASLHPSPLGNTSPAVFSPHSVGLPVAGSRQETPGLPRQSGDEDQQGASSGDKGVLLGQRESKVVANMLAGRDSRCSSIAPVTTQPPAAPAEVVDALEDLRDDLNELEVLHRLTSRSIKHCHSAEGISPAALASPEPRPAVQLLAGLAGGAAAAAAAAAATAAAPTEQARVGSPEADCGRRQTFQKAGSPHGGVSDTIMHAAASQMEDGKPKATHTPHKDTGQSATESQSIGPQPARLSPATDADYSARSSPISDATAVMGPQAAAPLSQDGCAWPVSESVGGAAAALPPAAPSPVPGVPGASSLDPALVALLQLSIQAQVQGQLGQLEAKIAELQRQNEALLAAATAASTPATPLPPHFRYSGHCAAITMTPLPLSPLSAVFDPSRGSSAVAGANEGGRERPIAGDTPAMPWSGSLDGLWLRGGRGVGVSASADQLGVLREAWPMLPAAWESTPSPQPSVIISSGTSQGHVPAHAVSLASGAVATAQPLRTAPAVTPAHTGRNVSASVEVLAGPFSPEELSQLPPTVQIFAPPQLRAAALAAVREQAQANRHSL